jgi:hypothetical protein
MAGNPRVFAQMVTLLAPFREALLRDRTAAPVGSQPR